YCMIVKAFMANAKMRVILESFMTEPSGRSSPLTRCKGCRLSDSGFRCLSGNPLFHVLHLGFPADVSVDVVIGSRIDLEGLVRIGYGIEEGLGPMEGAKLDGIAVYEEDGRMDGAGASLDGIHGAKAFRPPTRGHAVADEGILFQASSLDGIASDILKINTKVYDKAREERGHGLGDQDEKRTRDADRFVGPAAENGAGEAFGIVLHE